MAPGLFRADRTKHRRARQHLCDRQAKKLLAGEVGIDFVAGPTEILIIAAQAEPDFVAADMPSPRRSMTPMPVPSS